MTGKTERLLAAFALEREQWAQERRELLNRIARPEILQFPPTADTTPPEPTDAAEMQWVGLEVPDFVKVGDNNTEEG